VIFAEKTGRVYGAFPEAMVKGKDLLVVENIPMVTCPHCGES
jgi:hypothetical protein